MRKIDIARFHRKIAGVGISAQVGSLYAIQPITVHKKESSSIGSEQAFVNARRTGVTADILQVDGRAAQRLRSVRKIEKTICFCDAANVLNEQHLTAGAADVWNTQRTSAFTQQGFNAFNGLLPVVGWLKDAYRKTVAPGASQPGNRVADVFVTAGNDLVARLKLQTVADNVAAFSCVMREGNFVRRAV